MDILQKLDRIQEELGLCESGIRNITSLTKKYKKAEIYFHVDL
jgi:hypothetical protein